MGRLALQGDVWRYRGTFGVTRGRLALQSDVGRYPATFGVTRQRLALQEMFADGSGNTEWASIHMQENISLQSCPRQHRQLHSKRQLVTEGSNRRRRNDTAGIAANINE